MTAPKFKKGDTVFILTEWEGFHGDSFVVDDIIVTDKGEPYYYQNNQNWDWYIENGSFNGWWEERILSSENPRVTTEV